MASNNPRDLASERTAIFRRKELKKGAGDLTMPMDRLEPGECSGCGEGEKLVKVENEGFHWI